MDKQNQIQSIKFKKNIKKSGNAKSADDQTKTCPTVPRLCWVEVIEIDGHLVWRWVMAMMSSGIGEPSSRAIFRVLRTSSLDKSWVTEVLTLMGILL